MKVIVVLAIINCVFGSPYGPKKLTPEQIDRLSKWDVNDKQKIWEMSGQFEGDIVQDSEFNRNGVIDKSYRWPKNQLVYDFHRSINDQDRLDISRHLKIYERHTCITPVLRNYTHKYWINVRNDAAGCWSYIGNQKTSGGQVLNLGRGCMHAGTIIHEFMHALGFVHQQSSTDRDQYVNIYRQNIEQGQESNFDKYASNVITSFGAKYDYGSVMHYTEYAFSKNGYPTITSKNGSRLGNDTLSSTDIFKINAMYCTGTSLTVQTYNLVLMFLIIAYSL